MSVITAGARTPITAAGHRQASLNSAELTAAVFAALEEPELAVMGTAVTPGGNPARVAAIEAWGTQVPGVTLDAQCGSGLVSLMTPGSNTVAGGVESPSTVPNARQQAAFVPSGKADANMTLAADRLATRFGITRGAQDQFAVTSHQRYLDHRHLHEGLMVTTTATADDGPRAITETTAARFSPLPGCSTVTPLSAARITDGAAALSLHAAAYGYRIVDTQISGGDPQAPGIAPVDAVRALCTRQGIELDDIAVIEIVEAYAAQVLACTKLLELEPARINRIGGALAFGHPWGASGAIAVLNAITQLETRPNGSLALVASAVAGGMGVALLLERAC